MATEQDQIPVDKGNGQSSTTTEVKQRTEDQASDELELDIVFDVLKNVRRRRLLRYLKDQSGEVTLSDVAEHLAAIENDTTPERLDSQQRKRVYVGLYQSHLPRLDSMGVLTFDRERGLIERTPAASQLDKYLYDDTADTSPWNRYYTECIGLSAVVLLFGAVTGVIGSLGAIVMFVSISSGVVGLAAFHASGHL